MKKMILVFLSLIVCIAIFANDRTFPAVTVTANNNPTAGYVYLSNFILNPGVDNTPYLMILDNQGQAVWSRQMNAPLHLDFKIQPNGMMTYFDIGKKKFYGMNKYFEVVDSFYCIGYETDEHELRILPNGNYVLFGVENVRTDMTQYIPAGLDTAIVTGNILQEITPQRQVVFEWKTLDPGHYSIGDCTQTTLLLSPLVDYAHCNAIEIAADGNYIISSRHLDEISKIDRTTGEFIWRMGGTECKNNQFTFIGDTRLGFTGFSHQHGIRLLPNGNFLLFDNGNLKTPPNSRAVEYAINEVDSTITRVWEYYHIPQIQTSAMGYAQRLDNGNTLICWGANDSGVMVTEVNNAGLKKWELTFPEDVYSYRAYRFPTIGGDYLNAPDSPANIQIITTNGLVNITWINDTRINNYKILSGDTPLGPFFNVTSQGILSAGQWTCVIPAGTSKFYQVVAVRD